MPRVDQIHVSHVIAFSKTIASFTQPQVCVLCAARFAQNPKMTLHIADKQCARVV